MRRSLLVLLVFGLSLAACKQEEKPPAQVSSEAQQKLQALGLDLTMQAFIASVEAGNVEAVELFLDLGFNPNETIAGGYSPLMAAAFHGQEDMARRLIEAGALPNLRMVNNNSALSMAEERGHNDIADLLRDAGAED